MEPAAELLVKFSYKAMEDGELSIVEGEKVTLLMYDKEDSDSTSSLSPSLSPSPSPASSYGGELGSGSSPLSSSPSSSALSSPHAYTQNHYHNRNPYPRRFGSTSASASASASVSATNDDWILVQKADGSFGLVPKDYLAVYDYSSSSSPHPSSSSPQGKVSVSASPPNEVSITSTNTSGTGISSHSPYILNHGDSNSKSPLRISDITVAHSSSPVISSGEKTIGMSNNNEIHNKSSSSDRASYYSAVNDINTTNNGQPIHYPLNNQYNRQHPHYSSSNQIPGGDISYRNAGASPINIHNSNINNSSINNNINDSSSNHKVFNGHPISIPPAYTNSSSSNNFNTPVSSSSSSSSIFTTSKSNSKSTPRMSQAGPSEKLNYEEIIRRNDEYFSRVISSQLDTFQALATMNDNLSTKLSESAKASQDFIDEIIKLEELIDTERRKWKQNCDESFN